MCCRFIGLFLLTLASAARSSLFENCDKLYELNDDKPVTINSQNFSLGKGNISSCRFVFVAPVDYIVELNCSVRMDQLDSANCPMKRFFIQTEGVRELHDAEFFCNQNGTERTIRRRSIMNRIVAAYATQSNVTDEKFNCTAQRVQSVCDCGWGRKVNSENVVVCFAIKFHFSCLLCALRVHFMCAREIVCFLCHFDVTQYWLQCAISDTSRRWRERWNAWISLDDCPARHFYK